MNFFYKGSKSKKTNFFFLGGGGGKGGGWGKVAGEGALLSEFF